MEKKKFLLLLVASVLVALPMLPGCAPEEEAPPLEEEKYITYLSLADYTGAIAGLNVPADEGLKAYFDYLNDKGGVNGVKIKFIGVDTRYDAARAVSAYRRYRGEHKLMMINAIGTHLDKAIAPLVEEDGLCVFTPADGYYVAHPGRGFLWYMTYQDMFGAALDWMLDDWHAKGNPGMPTVGYYHWDNPYGHEALRGGKEYAEKIGVNLLPPEFNPPGTVDHSIPLTRLADSGANYIYIGGIDPNPTIVLKSAYDLGLTEKIQFVTDVYGPSETVGGRLYPEAIEGCVVVRAGVDGDEARSHPLAKEIAKYAGIPLSDLDWVHIMAAVSWGMTTEIALRKALETVSYEDLTSNDFYKALQNITGAEREGLMGPIAYTDTERRQSWDVKFYQFHDGKSVPITDWRRCPDTVSLYDWE